MLMRTVRLLGVFLTSAMAVHAGIIVYGASLVGSQEVPPTGSPGTGAALVTIDTVMQTLSVNVTFSGLGSGTTASHIHCCAPLGVNAMVATTTPTFPGFPLGVTSGTYNMTFDLTMSSSYNPAFVTANGGTVASAESTLLAGLAAGQTYLNIHTTNFGGGEIRGQLAVVPEPATWILTGAVLAGLMAARRKKILL
jgi:hypothetical protein